MAKFKQNFTFENEKKNQDNNDYLELEMNRNLKEKFVRTIYTIKTV